MSTVEDRVNNLHIGAERVRDFYASNGQTDTPVTLFAEDFDWLLKRNSVTKAPNGEYYFGLIKVKRGYRKRKPRKRRPKETMFDG